MTWWGAKAMGSKHLIVAFWQPKCGHDDYGHRNPDIGVGTRKEEIRNDNNSNDQMIAAVLRVGLSRA